MHAGHATAKMPKGCAGSVEQSPPPPCVPDALLHCLGIKKEKDMVKIVNGTRETRGIVAHKGTLFAVPSLDCSFSFLSLTCLRSAAWDEADCQESDGSQPTVHSHS